EQLEPSAKLSRARVEPSRLVVEVGGHLGIGLPFGEFPRLARLRRERLVFAVRHHDVLQFRESFAQVAEAGGNSWGVGSRDLDPRICSASRLASARESVPCCFACSARAWASSLIRSASERASWRMRSASAFASASAAVASLSAVASTPANRLAITS